MASLFLHGQSRLDSSRPWLPPSLLHPFDLFPTQDCPSVDRISKFHGRRRLLPQARRRAAFSGHFPSMRTSCRPSSSSCVPSRPNPGPRRAILRPYDAAEGSPALLLAAGPAPVVAAVPRSPHRARDLALSISPFGPDPSRALQRPAASSPANSPVLRRSGPQRAQLGQFEHFPLRNNSRKWQKSSKIHILSFIAQINVK